MCYTGFVHLSVRLDEDAARALEYLERARGMTRSEAVRDALIRAAGERFAARVLRVEGERLMNDPDYRDEVARIAADWDAGSDAW